MKGTPTQPRGRQAHCITHFIARLEEINALSKESESHVSN